MYISPLFPCALFGTPCPVYNTDGETSCHCPLTTIKIFPLSEADTCGSPDITTLPLPTSDSLLTVFIDVIKLDQSF